MSTELTLAQIRLAQGNDLAGIAAVVTEMDSRLDRLASQTAGTMATNPARYSDYVADFRQDASVALFEALPRWEGDSVDDFRAFIYRSVAAELKAKAHAERNAGVDRDALSVFKAMVELANGDVYRAEQLAQTEPAKGKRLSADRAHAARIAWQGTVSADKPLGEDGEATLADTLVAPAAQPDDEVRPKVGHGAALEALAELQWHGTSYKVLNSLPANDADIDAIEAAVKLPRDPAERRNVLSAVAILRSYVSTAADGDLVDDLRNAADEARDERAVRIAKVREVLDQMMMSMKGQALALMSAFGIGGYPCYGFGAESDAEGHAAYLGCSVSALKFRKSNGRAKFAELYIKRVARSEAEAEALTLAAAAGRVRAGRK